MSLLSKRDLSNLQEITKGYSSEKKYKIVGDQAYFLKISPLSFAERKRLEMKYLRDLSTTSLKQAQLLEVAFQEDKMLSLYNWIDGKDFRDLATTLSAQELYAYGIQAGSYLRDIHSLPIDEKPLNWEEHYRAKINRKIAAFSEVHTLYPDGSLFIDFIENHSYLLQHRPQSLCHGDYHVGNLMIEHPSNELVVIDFGSLEIGDPYEEFNRMIWNAQLSEEFATGLIHGYFKEKQIPEKFWGLMALYMATDVIGSIPWAIPFGEQQVQTMIERAEAVLDWYQKFEQRIPSFYKGEASRF
ncbi:aminoglycoside phosphotransferase family protein [Streptococcus ovuberis]|uniref:Phosphotransferase n=1 Tax=Streptococcus ovuberis TaxID=1936207 RepID=A0A7X6MY54_9STRE|nr:phosphotransferase [Streptococcus ovuberis]NKZ20505.1 phosphotransferase [Streptococcus ovuberis]